MHVLHILPYLETGGTEKHVLTLITALRNLQLCTGEVLAPPGPFAAQLAQADIAHTVFPSASAGLVRMFRGFSAGYRACADRADLVHVHGSPDLLVCTAMMRSGFRPPRVLTVHGFHGQGARISYRFAAYFGSRLAQAVICVTGSEEKLLLEAGMRPDKLHRVYNGVADPRGVAGAGGEAGASGEAGAGGEAGVRVRIAFIGRLAGVKGVDVLLQAAATLLFEHGLPIALDIYGTGPDADALHNQAATLGITEQVTFHGYCPDAVARLRGADIFCLPSREDMGPLVCAEAMAQRKPVVSTLVGGIPEMVADGETGLLVPADDAPALAAALGRLVRDAQLRTSMGSAGRRRYEALFTQEAMARRTYEVYRTLLPA